MLCGDSPRPVAGVPGSPRIRHCPRGSRSARGTRTSRAAAGRRRQLHHPRRPDAGTGGAEHGAAVATGSAARRSSRRGDGCADAGVVVPIADELVRMVRGRGSAHAGARPRGPSSWTGSEPRWAAGC
ncbi:hypothetical protein HBB16_16255 [Pseudonocardia sp. MCCB 268]|nr:hypothetical protein [Pseudonocardia cytotoxica]